MIWSKVDSGTAAKTCARLLSFLSMPDSARVGGPNTTSFLEPVLSGRPPDDFSVFASNAPARRSALILTSARSFCISYAHLTSLLLIFAVFIVALVPCLVV